MLDLHDQIQPQIAHAHLVLEVLRRHERVDEPAAHAPRVDGDLAARPADVGVLLEDLVQRVKRGAARARAGVDQDADVGLELRAGGVEEPPMRIELLGVLLLEDEAHLDRRNAAGDAARLVHDDLRRVLRPQIAMGTGRRTS